LLRNWACLGRRSMAGRAALLASIPTPRVGLLRVPAGTVFRMAFLASLRDALVWPRSCSGGAARSAAADGLALPPANLLPSLWDGFRTPGASRRDAGILAGGRGRVSGRRHPRKPSPRKLTRTPAGVRGKPRGIERAATGGQPPTAGPVRCRTWRVMIRTQSWTWNGGSVRPQRIRTMFWNAEELRSVSG
jgi:hypothetical protein